MNIASIEERKYFYFSFSTSSKVFLAFKLPILWFTDVLYIISQMFIIHVVVEIRYQKLARNKYMRDTSTKNSGGVSSPLGDWVIFPTKPIQSIWAKKTPIQLIYTLIKFRGFTFFCIFILQWHYYYKKCHHVL